MRPKVVRHGAAKHLAELQARVGARGAAPAYPPWVQDVQTWALRERKSQQDVVLHTVVFRSLAALRGWPVEEVTDPSAFPIYAPPAGRRAPKSLAAVLWDDTEAYDELCGEASTMLREKGEEWCGKHEPARLAAWRRTLAPVPLREKLEEKGEAWFFEDCFGFAALADKTAEQHKLLSVFYKLCRLRELVSADVYKAVFCRRDEVRRLGRLVVCLVNATRHDEDATWRRDAVRLLGKDYMGGEGATRSAYVGRKTDSEVLAECRELAEALGFADGPSALLPRERTTKHVRDVTIGSGRAKKTVRVVCAPGDDGAAACDAHWLRIPDDLVERMNRFVVDRGDFAVTQEDKDAFQRLKAALQKAAGKNSCKGKFHTVVGRALAVFGVLLPKTSTRLRRPKQTWVFPSPLFAQNDKVHWALRYHVHHELAGDVRVAHWEEISHATMVNAAEGLYGDEVRGELASQLRLDPPTQQERRAALAARGVPASFRAVGVFALRERYNAKTIRELLADPTRLARLVGSEDTAVGGGGGGGDEDDSEAEDEALFDAVGVDVDGGQAGVDVGSNDASAGDDGYKRLSARQTLLHVQRALQFEDDGDRDVGYVDQLYYLRHARGRYLPAAPGYATMKRTLRKPLSTTPGSDASRYLYIDVVNCHPKLVAAAAEKHNQVFPALRAYIADRDLHLRAVCDTFGVERAAAKALFLRILFGGGFAAWLDDCKADAAIQISHPNATPPRRVQDFQREYPKWRDFMLRQYPRDDGGRRTDPNSELAIVLQSLEREVVMCAMRRLQDQGWTVGSMIYDGFFVDGLAGRPPPDLAALATYVSGQMGLGGIAFDFEELP